LTHLINVRNSNKPIDGHMKIKKIWLISFSPTGTSRSVVNAIVSGIRGIPFENIDLTSPGMAPAMQFGSDELVIIGVPVYAGRVAPLAVKRLGMLRGDNTPAVIVVAYGNRAFEDALIELRDIALQAAFRPIAACTFIGEHSFSGPETPIAAGRPDSMDLATAEAFGMKISEKLAALDDPETAYCPKVPGNSPYKEGMGPLPFAPGLVESACTQCAACLPVCPTRAISLETTIEVDHNLCIFCCACIKVCPEDALIIDADPIKQKRQWLFEHCTERKKPELYL
jgi:ferredoxin